MVSRVQFREVSWKLDNLREDRRLLYTALDGYLDDVLTAGQLWVQSRGSAKQTHQEICSILDQAMFYIEEKLDELSASPTEEVSHETESALPLIDAAQASANSLTLPPPLPVSSSCAKISTTTSTDQLLLKLQERMDDLESKTSTKSELADAIAEVKSGMEDTQKTVKKCEDRLNGPLERFNTSTTFTNEYIANRSKDDTWFMKCEERMNALDEDTNQLRSDVSEVKRKVTSYDDSFDEVDRKVIIIDAKFVEVEKEKDAATTRIRGLEEKLETCQAQLVRVDGLDDKVKQIEEESERDRSRMKVAEKKLGKLIEKIVDLEIQRLGILEDRLLRVEDKRHNDMKDFDDVKENLVRLTSRVEDVEKKQEEQHQPVGFTAYTESRLRIHGDVIKGFDKILSNKGGHYDVTTGVFTAPVSGKYMAAFCHRQCGEGGRRVHFCHERVSPGQESLEITATWTWSHDANSSNVIVLDMEKGDKLYPKSSDGGFIIFPCAFSCALLG